MSLSNAQWSAYQPVRGTQTAFLRVAGNKRRTSAQAGYGGYLTKKGQLVRSWKKRWFQLSYGCLEYFEDEAAYQANKRNGEAYEVTNKNHTDLDEGAPFRPKGGILLVGAEIIHSDSEILQMGIICSDRTLTVKAEDAEKLQQWHTQLQLHIDLANEDALAMNDINDGVVKWVQRIAQIAAEGEERLAQGQTFKKYCGGMLGSKKHARTFKLSEDKKLLMWGAGAVKESSSTKKIEIANFHYVEAGIANTAFSSKRNAKPELSLTLGTSMKELCLEAPDEETRNNWIADLYAIAYSHSLSKLQEAIGDVAAKKLVAEKANLRKAIKANSPKNKR